MEYNDFSVCASTFQSSYIEESSQTIIKVLRQNFIPDKNNLLAGGDWNYENHYSNGYGLTIWTTTISTSNTSQAYSYESNSSKHYFYIAARYHGFSARPVR